MADTRKYNLGGNCAIAAAVGYIIVGITFFSLPLIQRGSQGSLQLTEYFNSIASDSSLLELQYWSFSFAALMGLAVMIAANRFFRDLAEDLVDWATVVGLIGYGVMCTNFIRIADVIPQRAKFFVEGGEQIQQAMQGANPLTLDPTGVLSFGFVGFWFLIINYMAIEKENFPNILAYIGLIGGILHIFVAIGNIIDQQILISIAAGLGGIVLGPIWLIWFGMTLKKG